MTDPASLPGPIQRRIRIFRPGEFTSQEGRVVSFARAQLEAIAASYDSASDPAPLVIGHPKTDDPAKGWVGRLSVDADDSLVAEPIDVDEDFAGSVRAGRYRKVSAQFYSPDHPSNPKPGTHYLKHVGFLGAAAPGVKGLGTVSFAEDEAEDADGAELLNFTQPLDPQETQMTDPEKKPAETAEQTASFAERTAALDTREQELAGREAAIETAAADARHIDHVSFAESLVKDAKLAPAGKDLVIGVLDTLGNLSADTANVISFGEGEAAAKLEPVAAMKKLFEGAQPLVSFGEAAGRDKGEPGVLISFAAPDGYSADPDQASLYTAARKIQQDNPKLAWMDCVKRAQTG